MDNIIQFNSKHTASVKPIDAEAIEYLAELSADTRWLVGDKREEFIQDYVSAFHNALFHNTLGKHIENGSDWWLVLAALCHEHAICDVLPNPDDERITV